MPRGDSKPRGEVRLTLALGAALAVTLIPLTRVIVPGSWLLGALVMTLGLLATGFALRRVRMPAVGVSATLIAAWTLVITTVFFAPTAFAGVIPTTRTLDAAGQAVTLAAGEILLGVAPMAPTPSLVFIIVAAMGVLTIALDHVVMTARMPLLATIALVAVWLIPAIAVPSRVDVFAFILLAIAVLWLLRAETRTREAPVMAAAGGSGITAVAVTIAAAAIVTAVVVGPALPAPVASIGSGTAASIDPTLNLGDDLRARRDTPVLTMYSDAAAPPSLRVATLSSFEGEVWLPDRVRSVSLDDDGMEPVTAAEGIALREDQTNVSVSQLSSAYLPVPFPAVDISGLVGIWRSVPYSRTVLSVQSNAQGQNYEVVTQTPRPTAEQIRATEADVSGMRLDVSALPPDTPPLIGATARAVTADAATDYDRLVALQDWFRGPDFTYSLTAPVEWGFDEPGVVAVERFLEVREGYCVHFAGAFALMARALDMPSRIVVGFLPGDPTGETVDGKRVIGVTTAQLHAWPEVHFEGIGWVPFEPTKSLGTPTVFRSADSLTPEDQAGPTPVAPTPTASTEPSAAPGESAETPEDEASGTAVRPVDLRPYLATLAAIAALAFAPRLLAAARRRLLRRRGTMGAAWRMLQNDAVDLGASAPASDTPRTFGARLIAQHGAPEAETMRVVAALERASYSPHGVADPDAVFDDVARIRAAMLDSAGGAERVRAQWLPRSLVVTPGSALAT